MAYLGLTLLVCFLVACILWSVPGRSSELFSGDDTIFVSVASYRDTQCSQTIRSLFEQADKPERVFVGLCEQNKADQPGEACVPAQLPRNVRRVVIHHSEAKGPTYARYLCSTLYQDETWFLQIDSHSKFVKGWDTKAIASARACPSDRAVLTHYPRKMEEFGGGDPGVPVLCKSKFDGQGVVTFESVIMKPPKDGVPRVVPFVSGGFVFMPGRAARDVPYDPSLPYLFQGEEILHSARLWTSGYDFYAPLENIVYHFYERKDHPKFWQDVPGTGGPQKETLRKVRRLLGLEQPPISGYQYGMGTARTLESYWRFAGIDIVKKTSESQAKFCV